MPLKEFSLQYTLENASFRAYKNTIEILNLRKISIASAHFVTKPLSYVEREETQEQRAIPSIIFANRYFQGPKILVALHFLPFWSNERTNERVHRCTPNDRVKISFIRVRTLYLELYSVCNSVRYFFFPTNRLFLSCNLCV